MAASSLDSVAVFSLERPLEFSMCMSLSENLETKIPTTPNSQKENCAFVPYSKAGERETSGVRADEEQISPFMKEGTIAQNFLS